MDVSYCKQIGHAHAHICMDRIGRATADSFSRISRKPETNDSCT